MVQNSLLKDTENTEFQMDKLAYFFFVCFFYKQYQPIRAQSVRSELPPLTAPLPPSLQIFLKILFLKIPILELLLNFTSLWTKQRRVPKRAAWVPQIRTISPGTS